MPPTSPGPDQEQGSSERPEQGLDPGPTGLPFPVRPRRPGDPEPDLELYHLAHRALLREAGELADLGRKLAEEGIPYTTGQARTLAVFARVFVGDLRRHHRTEDEIGWPLLAASAPDCPDLTPLTWEHAQAAPVIDALWSAVGRLVDDPDSTSARDDLADNAHRLSQMLETHIAEEERVAFPAIRAHVSAENFNQWDKLSDRDLPLRDLWVLVPSTVRSVDPADLGRITAKAPRLYRVALRLFRGHYNRRHRLVFG
ncbi:hemerythrin domain-containing protein [Frankia sp. Cppng1_Ct_nod]|uniref:hemerythrin domain-containing protein n=1 Tax=Frankia sp. Cppng1_Ct_nod TaxID=2897162 RepID=UPI001041AAE4|nr:hemerythrin domain-containing protein [Frankia sp. Cppng1_Ct_nod]